MSTTFRLENTCMPKQRFFICLLFFTALANACTVPVYRYALEKWHSDPYRATIFFRDSLGEEQAKRVRSIVSKCVQVYGKAPENCMAEQDGITANLTLRFANLSDSLDINTKKLWEANKANTLPFVVIRFPRSARMVHVLWSGPLEKLNAMALIDSPSRQTIIDNILEGETGVWALLKTGDKKKDGKALSALKRGIRISMDSISLPEIDSVDRKELLSEGKAPLKISFTIVEIDRADAREVPFISMLIKAHPDLMKNIDKPIAVVMFGRGRALAGYAGKDITSDTILESNAFLASPCACVIKEENPGIDILMMKNWNDVVTVSKATSDPLPQLHGFEAFMEQQEATD